MAARTAVTCFAVLLILAPAALAQLAPRPIIEHLGMLMWADEVPNFQVRMLRRCVPGCQPTACAILYPSPGTARRRGSLRLPTQRAVPLLVQDVEDKR